MIIYTFLSLFEDNIFSVIVDDCGYELDLSALRVLVLPRISIGEYDSYPYYHHP